MKEISFLHCSDIHLDMPFRYLGDTVKAAKRRQDLLDVFDGIIGMAEREGVDFLLVSGDLYEHEYTLRKTILHVRDRFAGLRDIKVIMLPGNHDPYTANSFYSTIEWPGNVCILSADMPSLVMEDKNTCIFGMGWEDDVACGLERIRQEAVNPERINILMFHGTMDMPFSKKAFNPADSSELAGLGMDYIAIGHFHNSFGEYGPARNIFNPGSPEPLALDQTGDVCGIYAVDIQKEGGKPAVVNARFISTGKRMCRDIVVFVDDMESAGDIERAIMEKVKDAGSPDDLYRAFLKGYKRRDISIDAGMLEEKLSGSVFFLKVNDETSEAFDYEKVRKTPGIKGKFVSKMLDRLGRLKDSKETHEARMLERALKYGLQALDEGKVDLKI
jgi:exonuclease SbcD